MTNVLGVVYQFWSQKFSKTNESYSSKYVSICESLKLFSEKIIELPQNMFTCSAKWDYILKLISLMIIANNFYYSIMSFGYELWLWA